MEATGGIFAFALNHADGTFTKVATIASGFNAIMALEFDRDLHNFWAVCDEYRGAPPGRPGCNGRQAVLEIDTHPGSLTKGQFVVTHIFERPAGMPSRAPADPEGDNCPVVNALCGLNNEGFTIAPQAQCVDNLKPVFWADDGATGGHAIRAGTLTCGPLDKDQCKQDGWQLFGIFNNQGECVELFETDDTG